MRESEDHYEFLGVDMFASHEEIRAAIERFSKQANALANTAPERSQQLRERLRRIREDLLTTPARRESYNRRLPEEGRRAKGDDLPLTADWKMGPASAPSGRQAAHDPLRTGFEAGMPSSGRSRRIIWGAIVVIPLAALLAFGVVRSLPVLGSYPHPTATPTASATPTGVPTATPRPTPTPLPPPSATPFQPTVITANPAQQAVANAVEAYNSARKLRSGPTYDDSQVYSTMTGVASRAILCLVDNNGKNLQDIGAYLVTTGETHGSQAIAIDGNTAALREHKSDVQFEYYADGTHTTTPEGFTVSYTLVNDGTGWKVSDYSWVGDQGGTGSAAEDASRCP
jgi:hypothetical protein